jgi:lysophospholipase L1-like esterase
VAVLMLPMLLLSCFGCLPIKPTNSETAEDTSAQTETSETVSREQDVPTPPKSKLTIACIGDSITEGIGVSESDRRINSYPAQLQTLLGDDYEVLNYGKSGATLCSSAHSFYQQKAWITYSGYRKTLKDRAAEIDIAFIMLGTNEANSDVVTEEWLKSNRAAVKADYEKNLRMLLNILKQENPDVTVYFVNAPKSYRADKPLWETNMQVIRSIQSEVAVAVADEFDLHFVDLYRYSSEQMDQADFSDGLHPNKTGYAKLAEKIKDVIQNGAEDAPQPLPPGTETTEPSGDNAETVTQIPTGTDTDTEYGEVISPR